MRPITRREFVAAAGSAAASLPAARRLLGAVPGGASGGTVVFQGDSITDGRRIRTVAEPNVSRALGFGYPLLVASALLREQPSAGWRFFNRGVSGDRVPELAARWGTDTLALRPAVLTVLVGVNDYWHTRLRNYAGTTADYENGYAELLASTRRAHPGIRLIVLEPFVLPVGFVDRTWFPAFDERRAAARRVADRVSATFVPLQEEFDRLAADTGPAHWAADGVHPTPAGDAVIAERLLPVLRDG
ncbi:MAG TPA: GDSL-type esterase/lipase family protein [Gemmatimonadaceae bacterium]|nr:GDSL-type esterase/lipase family protein [Gemmatimonadaceae bacterium]